MALSIPFTARLYISGYKGILTGDSILLSNADIPALIESFHKMGGSPIGSSRVKLTNIEDCISRGYVPKGKVPLEVAAEQVGKQAPSPSQLQHQAQISPTQPYSASHFFAAQEGRCQRAPHHWGG